MTDTDAEPPALPVDSQGWPAYQADEVTASSHGPIKNSKAADWAVKNAYSKKNRYAVDCTNFVSKALRKWSAAQHFYRHWSSRRRIRWRMKWSEVKRGDVMLWDYYGTKEIGHISIVSKADQRVRPEIYYAQHTNDYAYRYLSEVLPSLRSGFPNLRIYVFKPIR